MNLYTKMTAGLGRDESAPGRRRRKKKIGGDELSFGGTRALERNSLPFPLLSCSWGSLLTIAP